MRTVDDFTVNTHTPNFGSTEFVKQNHYLCITYTTLRHSSALALISNVLPFFLMIYNRELYFLFSLRNNKLNKL